MSQDRVSGFPEKGADLRGSPGNFQGSPGNFRGSLVNFRGTSGLLLSWTVREFPGKSPGNFRGSSGNLCLRIGNGVGKQGYGNRPPIDDRNPIRKFSIDPLCLQNQWDSTDSPQQRIKEKSRYGNSVSTPHRRYGHRLRTPFLAKLFADPVSETPIVGKSGNLWESLGEPVSDSLPATRQICVRTQIVDGRAQRHPTEDGASQVSILTRNHGLQILGVWLSRPGA